MVEKTRDYSVVATSTSDVQRGDGNFVVRGLAVGVQKQGPVVDSCAGHIYGVDETAEGRRVAGVGNGHLENGETAVGSSPVDGIAPEAEEELALQMAVAETIDLGESSEGGTVRDEGADFVNQLGGKASKGGHGEQVLSGSGRSLEGWNRARVGSPIGGAREAMMPRAYWMLCCTYAAPSTMEGMECEWGKRGRGREESENEGHTAAGPAVCLAAKPGGSAGVRSARRGQGGDGGRWTGRIKESKTSSWDAGWTGLGCEACDWILHMLAERVHQ